MKPASLLCASIMVAALASLPALARDKTEQVHFKSGHSSATISEKIKSDDTIYYVLKAGQGQVMSIQFAPDNQSCYFNLYPPGGGNEAIHVGSTSGNEFAGTLSVAGSYRAQVYLYRNAARRGETCKFHITFEISGKAAGNAGAGGGANIADLKGMDAVKAFDVMTSRGFKGVDTITSGDTIYGIYYNPQTRQCVQVTSANNRVEDARDIGQHPKCGSGGSSAGSTGDVPARDQQACLQAVGRETKTAALSVLSAESSEANNLVMVGVGQQHAPWKCLVKNGRVSEVSFAGSEGNL